MSLQLYLTPDSRTDLLEYNPDDVYIIGGIVETAGDVPYTLTKAKKLGIRHARLPTKRTVGYVFCLHTTLREGFNFFFNHRLFFETSTMLKN